MKSVKILAVLLAVSVVGVASAAIKSPTQSVTQVKCTANTTCPNSSVTVSSNGAAVALQCLVYNSRGTQVETIFAPSSVTLTYNNGNIAQASMYFTGKGTSYPNTAGATTQVSESYQGLDFKLINNAASGSVGISSMNCATSNNKGTATNITVTNN